MSDNKLNFQDVHFEGSVGLVKQLKYSDLPEIVFSGKSNVGKSSLINKLLYRKSIAKVSATPGKTQTINFFRLKNARLVDLPGYGYSKVSNSKKELWGELMETYFASNRDIRLVVQLLDMRHPPTKDDLNMVQFLDDSPYDFMIVLTKSDKLNKTQTEKRLSEIEKELSFVKKDIIAVPFSSLKGTGADEVRRLIAKAVFEGKKPETAEEEQSEEQV